MIKDRVSERVGFEGHSKGISMTRDFLVVGLSEHTFRDRRFRSRGQLVIMDRRSLSVIATVDLNFPSLPHPIGNINEVRCLSGEELAQAQTHPPNFDWPKLRLAKNDPVPYYLYRLQTGMALPLRRGKKLIRRFL
jgi:hypothetical protein